MQTVAEIVKELCKHNSYLLDEVEIKAIIALWQIDVDKLNDINMNKKLKNLAEHNAQASTAQWAMNDQSPRLNGIACPKCGEELYDSNPMITLTSIPAQKNVHCSKCEYVGYRVL